MQRHCLWLEPLVLALCHCQRRQISPTGRNQIWIGQESSNGKWYSSSVRQLRQATHTSLVSLPQKLDLNLHLPGPLETFKPQKQLLPAFFSVQVLSQCSAVLQSRQASSEEQHFSWDSQCCSVRNTFSKLETQGTPGKNLAINPWGSSSTSPKQRLSTWTTQISHTSLNADFQYESHMAAAPCQCSQASLHRDGLVRHAHILPFHAKEQICSGSFCPSFLSHSFPHSHFPLDEKSSTRTGCFTFSLHWDWACLQSLVPDRSELSPAVQPKLEQSHPSSWLTDLSWNWG